MITEITVKPGDYIYSIDKFKNVEKYKVKYVKVFSDSIKLYYDEKDILICSEIDITHKNVVNGKVYSWSEHLLHPLYNRLVSVLWL